MLLGRNGTVAMERLWTTELAGGGDHRRRHRSLSRLACLHQQRAPKGRMQLGPGACKISCRGPWWCLSVLLTSQTSAAFALATPCVASTPLSLLLSSRAVLFTAATADRPAVGLHAEKCQLRYLVQRLCSLPSRAVRGTRYSSVRKAMRARTPRSQCCGRAECAGAGASKARPRGDSAARATSSTSRATTIPLSYSTSWPTRTRLHAPYEHGTSG